LIHRKDDTAETMKNRLVQFHKNNAPILAHYQMQNKLARIDAKRKVD